MSSLIQNVYDDILKHSGSLEAVRGSFIGMLQMYRQNNFPIEEIKEIEEILKVIEHKIKDDNFKNPNEININ